MSFAEAAALIQGDMLSATETRSEDYGGFKRTMGEAAKAQQDIARRCCPGRAGRASLALAFAPTFKRS